MARARAHRRRFVHTCGSHTSVCRYKCPLSGATDCDVSKAKPETNMARIIDEFKKEMTAKVKELQENEGRQLEESRAKEREAEDAFDEFEDMGGDADYGGGAPRGGGGMDDDDDFGDDVFGMDDKPAKPLATKAPAPVLVSQAPAAAAHVVAKPLAPKREVKLNKQTNLPQGYALGPAHMGGGQMMQGQMMQGQQQMPQQMPQQSAARPGDWICPGCSVDNFATRSECFKCRHPRPPPMGAAPPGAGSPTGSAQNKPGVRSDGALGSGRPGDWICEGCR